MKIEVLGIGGGLAALLGNTSFLIWNDDESSAVLMDCGFTVYPKLREMEAAGREIISKIDAVAISHLHADHAGSLPALLQWSHYILKKDIKVAGVPLDDYFRLTMPETLDIADRDERIKTFPTEHQPNMPSNALYFGGVLYSGDTSKSALALPVAKEAEIIIHEGRLDDTHSHLALDMLAKSATRDIVAKTWIVHFASRMYEPIKARAKELGFAGVLSPGMVIGF